MLNRYFVSYDSLDKSQKEQLEKLIGKSKSYYYSYENNCSY